MPIKKELMKPMIAFMVFLGFIGLIAALIFIEIPEANRDILNILIGIYGGVVYDVTKSYFKKGEM